MYKTPDPMLIVAIIFTWGFSLLLAAETETTYLAVSIHEFQPHDLDSVPKFLSNNTHELSFFRNQLKDLEVSMQILNASESAEFFEDKFREIDKIFFDIYLSLSLSNPEAETLVSALNLISDSLTENWKKYDPRRFSSTEGSSKPDFHSLRNELEQKKNWAVATLFDGTRYIGSEDGKGKHLKKRLSDLESELRDPSYFSDPIYRTCLTYYKFLDSVAQIFLDYNNLFRMPEKVMLSIQEQFERKLREVKIILTNSFQEDLAEDTVTKSMADANLIFRLLPLFRDPIGNVSVKIDVLLVDIRTELVRLNMPCDALELCFIKVMRIRFEKVWYSIDWVFQYFNFIYVQFGKSALKAKTPDFSAAAYLFHFADWADTLLAWNIESLEGRLITFTIRSLQNELELSEIFKSVKLSDTEPKNE